MENISDIEKQASSAESEENKSMMDNNSTQPAEDSVANIGDQSAQTMPEAIVEENAANVSGLETNVHAEPNDQEPVQQHEPAKEEPIQEEPAPQAVSPVAEAPVAQQESTVVAENTLIEDPHDEEHLEEPHAEEDHHGLEEDEPDFTGMGKEELLKFVTDASNYADGRNINKKVQTARGEFNRIVREERAEALQAWKDEGNEGEFEPEEDEIVNEFNRAFKAYKKKRLDYINNLNKQKDLNLEAKKSILEKLKELTENENDNSFNEFKKLQETWRSIGHVPITEAENIWNTYNFYIDRFYEQRSLYSEFKELDRKRNLTAKEDVVTRIETLLNQEDLSEAMRMLKQYQEEWRHIGPVPKESLEEVIQRYKAAVLQIYEKRDKLSEEIQKLREQNYETKIALLGKIEEIAAFNSDRVQEWINKNQELGQWIENWRSIGSVPLAKTNELKERFSAAVRNFNRSKNVFFRNRKKEKVDNLRRKIELCEKVEGLLTVENPANHKKEVIHMQDEWKKVGPLPAKYSDKVWKRFQAACDAFFSNLSSQYSAKGKEEQDNMAGKVAVIEKIEALTAMETIEAPDKQIKALQDEYNAFGFVPIKDKDKVRKRYLAALNALINKARSGLKEDDAQSGGNSSGRMGYQLMLESWSAEHGGNKRIEIERNKHQRDLKKIENEIATLENNMEFFRNSKNADQLKLNLEKQIEQLKEKMVELQEKLNIIRNVG